MDQKWALKQLKDELQAFKDSAKRSPKPEYYVFVTNVELSSAASGGKDAAEVLISSYCQTLPLKGHALWDANQLSGFLTTYDDLRRHFTVYLTSGDVLAVMLAEIERRQRNGTQILTAYLERELRADEASRLDQAGNRTEEQLRLARLFFDVPASKEPLLVPPEEKPDNSGKLPHGVLWEILREGSRKLDPRTVYQQEIDSPQSPTERFPTRFVLLGGPGSGKSTVGQFLAQIHRAALLSRRPEHLLEPQARLIIRETLELCNREGIPWPATPRYPFRVELNRFAKALSSKESDHVDSLEHYLLNGLKRQNTLAQEDLLEWLATYPWLLILDGLDEVPATSNRDSLVKAVNDFLAEARQAEADLFVVATSRQQGYGGEFANAAVAFRHILPLSTSRALRYVESYAEARFGVTDPNRARDVVDKLRRSSKRELTAQLMASPLQVTFMATVVAARGDPGEDRWQLFDSYYRTIYDRERQKAVPPYDAVLSKQQPTIERLHHDIGFWLQFRGEQAGGSAVSLPILEFERLVDSYLSEIGREGLEKKEMVKLIVEAAHYRLVFLTSRVAGELSFDVRSLQEYMAAECLMTGDQEFARARLRAIAPAAYWRNVFLFAASKCFADARSRHLQDTIRVLCEDLNNAGDPLLDVTKAGSELALDILQSGAVAENPNHARHLARIGLYLLIHPYLVHGPDEGASIAQRLAQVYREPLQAIYRQELELRIGQADPSRTLGAWPLIVRLIGRRINWASELGNQHWPTDPQLQLMISRQLLPDLRKLSWLVERLEKLVFELELGEVFTFLPAFEDENSSEILSTLSELWSKSQALKIILKIGEEEDIGIQLRVTPAFQPGGTKLAYDILARNPPTHRSWLPFVLTSKFLSSPDRKTLAELLTQCADGGWTCPQK